MKIRVKICGIRRLESALAVMDAGADFLGFNFVKSSKRLIDPLDAFNFIAKIKGKIKTVGVFQNEKLAEVNKIIELLQLDYAQLHGEENNQYCQLVKTKVIKVVRLDDSFDLEETIKMMENYQVKYFLLDRIIQGQGELLNLDKARKLSNLFPIFFAGGLNIYNVSNVIKVVRPYGVDVASGIETNGLEDIKKIKEFIKIVKN